MSHDRSLYHLAHYQPLGLYRYLRPLLFSLPPERSHQLSLLGLNVMGKSRVGRLLLSSSFAPRVSLPDPLNIDVRLPLGLQWSTSIGLAAGYDKDATSLSGLAALGFGHIEIGTITPKPQPGNEGVRVRRLSERAALINRMGFPSAGVEVVERRLAGYREREGELTAHLPMAPRLGINIGKNKDTPNELAYRDYSLLVERLGPYADYLTVNISSPNTPQLRSLQALEPLRRLLEPIMESRAQVVSSHGKPPPVVIKLSPEGQEAPLEETLDLFTELGVNGVILANTRRVESTDEWGVSGGMSGAPLFQSCLELISRAKRHAPEITVIASGGVGSSSQALRLHAAGADLIQIWTSLIYRGPSIIRALSSEDDAQR